VIGATLDHVGFVGRDIDGMRAQFTRLGFAPTHPEELLRADPKGGPGEPLGQSSCHAVLTRGYVELTAVTGGNPLHHLAPWAALGDGVQIIAFGVQSIPAAHAQCRRAGFTVSEPMWAAREIGYGLFQGEARFHWFMLQAGESPEALVCCVRNHTPELVYQPAVTRHRNTAQCLEEVAITCSEPLALVERYERLLGVPASAGHGGSVLPLAQGELTISTPEAFEERTGCAVNDDRPRVSLVGIRTADLAAAEGELESSGTPFRRRAEGLFVPAPHACGAVLVLRPPG
jgi:hypothetical protein